LLRGGAEEVRGEEAEPGAAGGGGGDVAQEV